MPRYEAHITTDLKHATTVRDVGTIYGWKFSQIHGCPIMGEKTYCYLTHYNTDAKKLRADIDNIVFGLNTEGIEVLRAKIERIVFDTKTDVNELEAEIARA